MSPTNRVLDEGQDWMNPFSDTRGDTTVMWPFATLLGTLVINCYVAVYRDRRVTSYFETENEHVDFILPIMTVPYDFKKRQ